MGSLCRAGYCSLNYYLEKVAGMVSVIYDIFHMQLPFRRIYFGKNFFNDLEDVLRFANVCER